MLRAQKVENGAGNSDYNEATTPPVHMSSTKKGSKYGRAASKDHESTNICIEKTYTNAAHEFGSEQAVRKTSTKPGASPLKVNPNLVPKGCAPKNRNQKYEPLKNSR